VKILINGFWKQVKILFLFSNKSLVLLGPKLLFEKFLMGPVCMANSVAVGYELL